jgi:chromosome segregation ATPase
MRLPVRPWWWLWISGVLVVGTAVLAAQNPTQSPPPPDGTMRELVAEVRALRLAVERTSSLAARSQALLGRVQLQENRLADLGRRLDDARERVRVAAAEETKLSTDLAEMTRRLPEGAAAANERADVEAMLREMRAKVKLAQDQTAQLRADEQAVLTALTQEQTRWSDYNARLEALEQDFARPASRLP